MDANEIEFVSTWLIFVGLGIVALLVGLTIHIVVTQIRPSIALSQLLGVPLPLRSVFEACLLAATGLFFLYLLYSDCTKIRIGDSKLTFHYCWPRSNVTIPTSKVRSLRLLSEGRGYRSIIVVEADQMKIRCPALPNADAKDAADRLRMEINSKK